MDDATARDTTDAAGDPSSPHTPQQQPSEDIPSNLLLDALPPDTLSSILKLLEASPASIVAFSLTCSAALELVSGRTLWADLCSALLQRCPPQLRAADWEPAAWGLDSHQELYLSLLHPYRPLLRQRTWHATKMPAGQLLVLDAQPPRLAASSVFYKTLQGPAFSHQVFSVEVLGKAKACVCCTSCERHLGASPAAAPAAQLQFLTQHCSAAAAAAAPQAAAHSASDGSDGGGAGASAQLSQTEACCDAAAAVPGFKLSCSARCGSLYCESLARQRHATPHNSSDSTHPEAQQQHQQHGADLGPGAGAAAQTASSSSATAAYGASSSSTLLPLPAVAAPSSFLTALDLQGVVADVGHSREWRSSAVYRSFDARSTWLHARDSGSSSSSGGDGPATATSAAAAVGKGLAGLWRGTYGAHGVELVQLQLLQAPPGFDMWQQHQLPAEPLTSYRQCPPGVLLQPVLHTPAPDMPPARGAEEATGAPAAASTAAQGQAGSTERQQQQPDQPLSPTQQLLLVATKLTGDRHVPAGQVTFAIDLGSRGSSEGVGQPLQLPPGTQSDVRLHQPGTRPLLVKARYGGLAQIAEFEFQQPRICPVELLVFEGDCLGLLWQARLDSFSLLSRLPALP